MTFDLEQNEGGILLIFSFKSLMIGWGGLFEYSVTPEHVFDNFLNLDLGPDL